jgi:cytoskeletal protein CcmA (bactofilin family)
MWNQETTKPETPAKRPVPAAPLKATPVARIGQSVSIRGNVISAEDLAIDGRVDGTIDVGGGHRLTIGAGAAIVGDVAAGILSISGAVTGKVTATERLVIWETGSVDGDVAAPRLAVREGAVLHGRIDTGSAGLEEDTQPLRIAV